MKYCFVTHDSADFLALANMLDAYYLQVVGEVHLKYAEANRPVNFDRLMVVYDESLPVACGCWKKVDAKTAEIKRIYVLPEYRRKGIAKKLITMLETDAAHYGFQRLILETARTTPDSESLYLCLGYRVIDYYGSPAGAENCLCFEKNI